MTPAALRTRGREPRAPAPVCGRGSLSRRPSGPSVTPGVQTLPEPRSLVKAPPGKLRPGSRGLCSDDVVHADAPGRRPPAARSGPWGVLVHRVPPPPPSWDPETSDSRTLSQVSSVLRPVPAASALGTSLPARAPSAELGQRWALACPPRAQAPRLLVAARGRGAGWTGALTSRPDASGSFRGHGAPRGRTPAPPRPRASRCRLRVRLSPVSPCSQTPSLPNTFSSIVKL